MSKFTKLTSDQAKGFRQLECALDGQARLSLQRHAARARVRLATAGGKGLDPRRRTHARALAAFSRRAAHGYSRLQHLEGALRFVDRLIAAAARRAGVGSDR